VVGVEDLRAWVNITMGGLAKLAALSAGNHGTEKSADILVVLFFKASLEPNYEIATSFVSMSIQNR
jgi:hypothetical protein